MHSETAFAKPNESAEELTFDGNRWGWYIEYCVEECEIESANDSGEDDGSDDGDDGSDDGGDDGDDGDDSGDDSGDDGSNDGSGNGSDGTTDGGTGGQGSTGGTDPGIVCKESYARGSMNACFLDDGFNSWGWTNNIQGNYSADYAAGVNYTFDLIANAYDCDVLAGEVIGQVEVTIRGGDGRFTADMNVYTNDNYELNDLHFYIGSEPYPSDANGNETVDISAFTVSETGLSGNLWTMNDVEWPFNANLIVRVNACTASN